MDDHASVAALFVGLFTISTVNALCAFDCAAPRSADFADRCRSQWGGTVNNTCCVTHYALVTALDLTNCSYSSIESETFIKSKIATESLAAVEYIDLSYNDVSGSTLNVNVFRGMLNLTTLKLDADRFESCPIQRKVNTSYAADAWQSADVVHGVLHCERPRSLCTLTNFTCPEHSHCIDDGPALLQCVCDAGRHGYKCLKQGTFPFALFFVCIVGGTAALSALLWATQRRHVRDKVD